MYFKKGTEVIPEEMTSIWTCSNGECSCWMRDDFTLQNDHECPICHSSMAKDERMLPILTNNIR